MSSRLFIALLITFWICAIVMFESYLTQIDSQMPSSPCVSVIENGDFLDQNNQPYKFNGSITFWPKVHIITGFGVAETGNKNYRLKRQEKMKLLSKEKNRMIYLVESLHVDVVDDMGWENAFFSELGERLYMSVKKLSNNEYMYFINDNWVFVCRTR